MPLLPLVLPLLLVESEYFGGLPLLVEPWSFGGLLLLVGPEYFGGLPLPAVELFRVLVPLYVLPLPYPLPWLGAHPPPEDPDPQVEYGEQVLPEYLVCDPLEPE